MFLERLTEEGRPAMSSGSTILRGRSPEMKKKEKGGKWADHPSSSSLFPDWGHKVAVSSSSYYHPLSVVTDSIAQAQTVSLNDTAPSSYFSHIFCQSNSKRSNRHGFSSGFWLWLHLDLSNHLEGSLSFPGTFEQTLFLLTQPVMVCLLQPRDLADDTCLLSYVNIRLGFTKGQTLSFSTYDLPTW